MFTFALCALIALSPMLAPAQDTGAPAPPLPDGGDESAPGAPPIDHVDALLDALEDADRDIRTLSGELVYDRVMGLQGDLHRRWGRLYFESIESNPDEPPARRFAVLFDTLQIGRRVEEERIDLIFNGRWLIEKDYEHDPRPLLTRREVAPPGAEFDPMRLGEGPVPLPLGQRKEDILAHFEAEMLDAGDGLVGDYLALVNHGAGSYQLRLVPLEGDEAADKFKEVRLWYEKGTMHPRLARTRTRGGDTAFVQLGSIVVNQPLPAEAIDPGPPGDGWDVRTIELRGGQSAAPVGLDNSTFVLPPGANDTPSRDAGASEPDDAVKENR